MLRTMRLRLLAVLIALVAAAPAHAAVRGLGSWDPVAQRMVRQADILPSLRALGYDDVLTLEYEYRWHPQDLPEPAIGFARSAAALRAVLTEPATVKSAR